MTLAQLSPETLDKLKSWKYDRIVEKHEGPFDWGGTIRYEDPDFLDIEGDPVLLPLPRDQHPGIQILRAIRSSNGCVLTVFLKDKSCAPDPLDEMFSTGFLAVCERFPGEDFFLATVYHGWFIVENR